MHALATIKESYILFFLPQSVTYVQAKNIVDSSHLSGSVAVCDGILRLRVNFVRSYKAYTRRKCVKTKVWIATLFSQAFIFAYRILG